SAARRQARSGGAPATSSRGRRAPGHGAPRGPRRWCGRRSARGSRASPRKCAGGWRETPRGWRGRRARRAALAGGRGGGARGGGGAGRRRGKRMAKIPEVRHVGQTVADQGGSQGLLLGGEEGLEDLDALALEGGQTIAQQGVLAGGRLLIQTNRRPDQGAGA